MVDKGLDDFLVVVGNNVDDSLESFRLFRVLGASNKQRSVSFDVRAVDVSIRKSSGFVLFNLLSGKGVVGVESLDKKRDLMVGERLLIPIKSAGKPQVFLSFTRDFDDLPDSIKSHPYLGSAFELAYASMHSIEHEKELWLSQGKSEAEIQDKTTQSLNKYLDNVRKTMLSLQQKDDSDKGFGKGGDGKKLDVDGIVGDDAKRQNY